MTGCNVRYNYRMSLKWLVNRDQEHIIENALYFDVWSSFDAEGKILDECSSQPLLRLDTSKLPKKLTHQINISPISRITNGNIRRRGGVNWESAIINNTSRCNSPIWLSLSLDYSGLFCSKNSYSMSPSLTRRDAYHNSFTAYCRAPSGSI